MRNAQDNDIYVAPTGRLLLGGERLPATDLLRVVGEKPDETAMGLRYLKRVLGDYLYRLVEVAGTCQGAGSGGSVP